FRAKLAGFEDIFKSLFHVERLRCSSFQDACGSGNRHDQLLRYLRRCLYGAAYTFVLPDFPVCLNGHPSSHDFCGGIAPAIGKKHLRIVAIDGFPRLSFPGILGAVDALPIEFRWNTRAILMDPEEGRAFLDKTRKKWRSRIRGWKDQIFRTQNGAINLYAQEMAADAEQAMGVASAGDVQFAFYSSVVICVDEDRHRVEEEAA